MFARGLQQNALEVRAANCKTHLDLTHSMALARREKLTSFIALLEMEFLIISASRNLCLSTKALLRDKCPLLHARSEGNAASDNRNLTWAAY